MIVASTQLPLVTLRRRARATTARSFAQGRHAVVPTEGLTPFRASEWAQHPHPKAAASGMRVARLPRKPLSCPPKLSQPRESVQMVGACPDTPPSVASGAEPPAGPRRRLGAVCGLELVVVDHSPALAGFDSEGAGIGVAGPGHLSTVTIPCVMRTPSGGGRAISVQ